MQSLARWSSYTHTYTRIHAHTVTHIHTHAHTHLGSQCGCPDPGLVGEVPTHAHIARGITALFHKSGYPSQVETPEGVSALFHQSGLERPGCAPRLTLFHSSGFASQAWVPGGHDPFPLKRTRKPGHPPCGGEPGRCQPIVRGVGGHVRHGWATGARRACESGAGASRASRLFVFACGSGCVCVGGGSVSGGTRCPADRMTMHGHRPVTVGNADRRARNFGQVGSAVHTSCPTRARGCISLTVPGNPRAVRVQNYQRSFLAVLATRGRKNEFQCRKKCRQQLRRCPIT